MPIYEYQCGACGHRLEHLQKMSDPLLTECPACHAASLSKLMSVAGIQVKSASGGGTCPVMGDVPPACGAGACPACVTG